MRSSYEATQRESTDRLSSETRRSLSTYSENNPFAANINRLGPQRTTFTTQKLKILPDDPTLETVETSESVSGGQEVYSQASKIKEAPARKDAERLGKAHRAMLPRVTAYCTAASYRMRELAQYFTNQKDRKTAPKFFDECLYTPYSYVNSLGLESATDQSENDGLDTTSRIIRLDKEGGDIKLETTRLCDVFLFEFGVVVLWGFTVEEEGRFLKEIAKFENEKLVDNAVQREEFNYYVTQSYQPRVCWVRDGPLLTFTNELDLQ